LLGSCFIGGKIYYLGIQYTNIEAEREVSILPNKKISQYTIMYEDNVVLTFDRKTEEVVIHNNSLLPFWLRGKDKARPTAVLEWLIYRVDNSMRTYMNMVYVAREVGRDRDKVIADSSGVSFTDNFWIQTTDTTWTWSELVRLRDENRELSLVALTGKVDTSKDLLSGFTSLFTTKGYFPKAIIGGHLYKLKNDALLEYPAYLIGNHLGVSVAECSIEDNYVRIKLFTSENVSLVHASELKHYFDTQDEIYNAMIEIGRHDIKEQLQRMYIFNYIIGNPDLHDENTGLLYDARTFDFASASPCYDHNIAFQEGFGGLSRATKKHSSSLPLDDWAKMFAKNHPDIVSKLNSLPYEDIGVYLSARQLDELNERVQRVVCWGAA